MEYTNEKHNTQTGLFPFDPIVLLRDVVKRWVLIVLVALLLGVGAYIKTDITYTPVYQTSTTFVVTNRGSSSSVYSNLSSTSSLASVFEELLNSSVLRRTILNELGAQTFDGTIHAAAVPETNLLTVTVTASDSRTAFLVAQAIIDHHTTVTDQVVSGVVLEVLQNPTVPARPSNYANASGAMKKMMLVGVLAACVGLAALSFFRNAVRSGREARTKLECHYLGEIPHEEKYKTLRAKLRRRKTSILITNPATSFRFTEAIRKLRRRVEQHMHAGKVLMVTSLLENEGKSTVAVNLALAMAKKHSRVLLIDCDLHKPACHVLLEQRRVPHGVRDVLTGRASLSEALVCHRQGNLYMLLEKTGSHSGGDLLASENMQTLLRWAREEFDFVVLDLPPMSEVSDAESMKEYADASLLVVRQNVALAPAINKAVASLEGGNAKLLGCVLNNVYSTVLFSGQNHSYGGYGRYGHYGKYDRYGAKAPDHSGK